MAVRFRVYGTPTPQGSKIPGVTKTGRKFVREQAGEALTTWRNEIVVAAVKAMNDGPPLKGACIVHAHFYYKRPKTVSVKKRPLPTVAPDLDKVCRSVGDSLEAAGVFDNDAQITTWMAFKSYADDDHLPGVEIVVTEIKDGADDL